MLSSPTSASLPGLPFPLFLRFFIPYFKPCTFLMFLHPIISDEKTLSSPLLLFQCSRHHDKHTVRTRPTLQLPLLRPFHAQPDDERTGPPPIPSGAWISLCKFMTLGAGISNEGSEELDPPAPSSRSRSTFPVCSSFSVESAPFLLVFR